MHLQKRWSRSGFGPNSFAPSPLTGLRNAPSASGRSGEAAPQRFAMCPKSAMGRKVPYCRARSLRRKKRAVAVIHRCDPAVPSRRIRGAIRMLCQQRGHQSKTLRQTHRTTSLSRFQARSVSGAGAYPRARARAGRADWTPQAWRQAPFHFWASSLAGAGFRDRPLFTEIGANLSRTADREFGSSTGAVRSRRASSSSRCRSIRACA